MPSERLLKILDPLGHVRDSAPGGKRTAVVWAPNVALATVLRNRLIAADMHPLMATSFRHVASSLMPGARPQAELVILDLDATSDADLATLASIRWTGFTGPIIGVNGAGQVAPAMRALYQLEAVLPRRKVSTALHDLLGRLPPQRV
ncbi:MAG: hypothetical protein IPI49_14165 [Myxococcales bacterium]|jgi:hypothetical protein|nr:hypothetical protein [Myxococcales bacterium]HRC54525.1 hypothetical protein [Kofleriaceae bacterium]